MENTDNIYFQRWKEECVKRKDLEVKVEKLQEKIQEYKDIKKMAGFHQRENARYEHGLKHMRKTYDDLLEKSQFLEDSHQQLIALFKRYMLLDDKISNIKLSEESKTHIINETRAILHKENQQYAIGKTFVERNSEY